MSGARRFTVAPERISGDRVAFDREETRHLARVLRLGPGDLVVASDGAGHDYTVRLEALGETASGTILGVAAGHRDSAFAVTLLQGVPKGDKMEAIVRATTELGVARIVPVLAERTVVRLDPARGHERARRWQRIAREAAKQCGRAVVPEVDGPLPLEDAWRVASMAALRLCLWEGEAPALEHVLAATAAPTSAAVLVGPEGGLARAEIEAATAHGFRVASLGPRVLRTETAGPTIVALLQFRFGDVGRAGPAHGT